MTSSYAQRRTIVPTDYPCLATRYAPITLPRDTQIEFDREIALLMDRRPRRPDVVVGEQCVPVIRRTRTARDMSRIRDTTAMNRRSIYAKSYSDAVIAGVKMDKKPMVVR